MTIFTLFIIDCNQKSSQNSKIPYQAVYNKRKNIYSLDFGNQRKEWLVDGTLRSECQLKNNTPNGICKTYLPNGEISSIGHYRNGRKDGLWRWYYPNGQLYVEQEHNYKKIRKYWIETTAIGNEHGNFYRYFPDGNREIIGAYSAGYKHGKWTKYFRNGNIEFQGEFTSEKKIGKWLYYFPNGNIEIEEEYNKPSLLKKRIIYFPDGVIKCIQLAKTECLPAKDS